MLCALALVSAGFGAAGGVWAALARQRSLEGMRQTEAHAESRILADAVSASLLALRSQALLLSRLAPTLPASTAPLAGVPAAPALYWAEAEYEGARLARITTALDHPQSPTRWSLDPAARSPLRIALEAAEVSEVTLAGATVPVWWGRIPADLRHANEWVAVGFKSPGAEDTGKTRVSFVVIDPIETFPSFSQFAARAEGGGARAYLVSNDGAILAHSQHAYVGASFSGTQIFQRALGPLLSGERAEGSGRFQSIDRLPVVAGYLQVGKLPIGVVVERLTDRLAVTSAPAWLTTFSSLVEFSSRTSPGFALMVVIGGWVLCIGFAGWFLREAVRTVEPEPELELELALAPEGEVRPAREAVLAPTKAPAPTPMLAPAPAGASAGRPMSATEASLLAMRRQQQLLDHFESEARRLDDPRLVAHCLAASAAQLTSSPVMFFGYQRSTQSAVLAADAGFAPGEAPVSLQFKIDDAGIERAELSDRKIPSFADYPPLAQLLLGRLGVAHFEAWAITGYGPLGRQAGRPRLIGVLVILQASVDSYRQQDSLARLVRSTGHIYENSFFSQ